MVIALFNAGGRIALGKLSDRFGRINTLMMIYGLTALIMVYMSFGVINYPMFLTAVSLIGFCFGGFLALFPSVTADFFGTRNLGSNYGFMYQAYGISAFVGPLVVKTLPFTKAFLLAGLICLLAIAMAKLIEMPKQAQVQKRLQESEAS